MTEISRIKRKKIDYRSEESSMKNFRIFYEKNDEESCEELAEREPKERRVRRYRKKRDIEYPGGFSRYDQRLIPKS